MTSPSKAKGNKFEYDIVTLLNEVYDTKEFSRTPSSGAIMGRSNWERKQGLSENVRRTLGSDIIVPDNFNFAVECKHYKDKPNYAEMIKGPDTTLNRWLAETVFDAINIDAHPLLFFKTNRKGTHFAIPDYFYLRSSYFLMYNRFIIGGIDTFIENAESFQSQALQASADRNGFFETDDIQELLKSLDAK